ncbi:MAG: hypothetical protein L6R40_000309 [Gallowayella cf. fulva]|nr:MAG: hypothetical protein L6R40_000309 [Xanthomendoza cf. fulva]
MFASTFITRLTSSTPHPLLPVSSNPSLPAPNTDIPQRPSPTSTTAHTLLALTRQEAHLQSHIQYLLNVQSDRLLEGLGGDAAPAPVVSPSPSSFREATPYDNGGRRSAKEKPSLRAARKGISDAIHGLHTLKTQTRDLVHDDFSATTISLNRVQALRVKKTKLEDTIRGLEASPDRRELEDLGKEDEVLGEKISGMEMQLEELRARQRSVRVKVQEGWNREEARLNFGEGGGGGACEGAGGGWVAFFGKGGGGRRRRGREGECMGFTG